MHLALHNQSWLNLRWYRYTILKKCAKSLPSTFQHKFDKSGKVEDSDLASDLAHLLKDWTKLKLSSEIKLPLRTGLAIDFLGIKYCKKLKKANKYHEGKIKDQGLKQGVINGHSSTIYGKKLK